MWTVFVVEFSMNSCTNKSLCKQLLIRFKFLSKCAHLGWIINLNSVYTIIKADDLW